MSSLTVIPGLAPEAIEQLKACGIESPAMLAAIPPAELHRVLELTAWKKGNLRRAPTLDMVHQWARLAREVAVPIGGAGDHDDIPEAIVLPRSGKAPVLGGYVSPAQRARLAVAGSPPPAAPIAPLPGEILQGIPLPGLRTAARVATSDKEEPVVSRFNTFEDYQTGPMRVAPLSRHSMDAPSEPVDPAEMERVPANEEIPRTIPRGVVHPDPVLLVVGALISLLWRVTVVAAVLAVPWLFCAVPQPSDYAKEIYLVAAVLAVLGIAQLVVLGKARCRICSCHLFYSRHCAKNRKAHSIPGLGKTASLALHLLLFRWFRCMYCGTAIKLWSNKSDRAA
jgi:hypothetical protein